MSAVTNMDLIFYLAHSFNQDLSNWDVSAVTNMECMFLHASAFSQILHGDDWVESDIYMFYGSQGSISSQVSETSNNGHGGDNG